MSEVDKIKERYARRLKDDKVQQRNSNQVYGAHVKAEREAIYGRICNQYFPDLARVKLMEIGAGNGSNLVSFNKLGFTWENIFANELLEHRGQDLTQNLDAAATVHIGDAMDLEYDNAFDIVFQSTVFTSILDFQFKRELARKMVEMVKDDGIILWYDFKYDNPNNPDVKGINRKEIEALFEGVGEFTYFNVTLLPPLGRHVGNLYNLLNRMFPFLKTHLVCVIRKGVR